MELEGAKEDLEVEYIMAQNSGGCSCHNNPPCDFCVSGYSLEMAEFVELELIARGHVTENDLNNQTKAESDYDRAMRGIGT